MYFSDLNIQVHKTKQVINNSPLSASLQLTAQTYKGKATLTSPGQLVKYQK